MEHNLTSWMYMSIAAEISWHRYIDLHTSNLVITSELTCKWQELYQSPFPSPENLQYWSLILWICQIVLRLITYVCVYKKIIAISYVPLLRLVLLIQGQTVVEEVNICLKWKRAIRGLKIAVEFNRELISYIWHRRSSNTCHHHH